MFPPHAEITSSGTADTHVHDTVIHPFNPFAACAITNSIKVLQRSFKPYLPVLPMLLYKNNIRAQKLFHQQMISIYMLYVQTFPRGMKFNDNTVSSMCFFFSKATCPLTVVKHLSSSPSK